MNWAHVHLLLNHLPVVGAIVATGLLWVAVARESEELTKASLAVFVFVGITAVATYFTGEPAEEIVEELAGVSEAMIESHEEAALAAVWTAGAFGLLSLVVLIGRPDQIGRRGFTITALLASVLTMGVFAWTAYVGGQIRHSEIRDDGRDTMDVEYEESMLGAPAGHDLAFAYRD